MKKLIFREVVNIEHEIFISDNVDEILLYKLASETQRQCRGFGDVHHLFIKALKDDLIDYNECISEETDYIEFYDEEEVEDIDR